MNLESGTVPKTPSFRAKSTENQATINKEKDDIESRGHVRSDGVIAGGGAGNLFFFLEVATNVGDWSPSVDGKQKPGEKTSWGWYLKPHQFTGF